MRLFLADEHTRGFHALVESGSIETFLVSLLFIRLQSCELDCARELPLGGRCAVDIAIRSPQPTYIEAKQIHLKDGAKYVGNLVNDVQRHTSVPCLGALYFADERLSRTEQQSARFKGANRATKFNPDVVLRGLSPHFSEVWPSRLLEARLFNSDLLGGLQLYGFAVSPAVPPINSLERSRDR